MHRSIRPSSKNKAAAQKRAKQPPLATNQPADPSQPATVDPRTWRPPSLSQEVLGARSFAQTISRPEDYAKSSRKKRNPGVSTTITSNKAPKTKQTSLSRGALKENSKETKQANPPSSKNISKRFKNSPTVSALHL